MIRIEHLRKEYPNATPLQDVNAVINAGDVISVIGPSGTGKSTLLRCLNRLETPSSGRIWLDDTEVTDPKCDIGSIRRKMGMVFQSYNLFGHCTVIENIMLPQTDLMKKTKQEAYDEGMHLLRQVGLSKKALNYPAQLSGGQKQRVAIARTLAMNPEIILLDEPTSALDPAMVGEVEAVIRELARAGKTMMIATHAMAFARVICNRVFYMDEGVIYEEGPPEQVFDNPQREKTRRFIRGLKVLELDIESRDHDLPAMVGTIEEFCARNQIPPKLAFRTRLALEETIQQQLLPVLENPRIRAVAEYSEAAESADVTVCWNGPELDISRSNGDLSLVVLKGMIGGMHYTRTEADDLPNKLSMTVRLP